MVETLHDTGCHGFASDNYAGVHPEVLEALAAANGGHQVAYGEDVYTERLNQLVRSEFGDAAEAFPVFNGTGARPASALGRRRQLGDRAHPHR